MMEKKTDNILEDFRLYKNVAAGRRILLPKSCRLFREHSIITFA
jgi:hypothetical protein